MKLINFSTLVLIFTSFISCDKGSESSFSDNLSATTVLETINSLSFNEDIHEMVSESMELTDRSASSSRNTDTAADKGPKYFQGNKYGDCATVVDDEENNIKTVTFSGECFGKKGQLRHGTIVITYSETRNEVGSFRQVEYNDFYMNYVKIEGIRRSEILMIDENGNKTTQNNHVGGKMIYDDGTFSTKSSEMTRFTSKEDGKRMYSMLTGSSSGISTEGVSFSMKITSPIKFEYNCDTNGKLKRGKVPVEGTKTNMDGESSIITDFGDGTCDTLVEITKDGEVETVDLKDIKRGDRFKNILKKKNKKKKY
jgi:hypothetical protein